MLTNDVISFEQPGISSLGFALAMIADCNLQRRYMNVGWFQQCVVSLNFTLDTNFTIYNW